MFHRLLAGYLRLSANQLVISPSPDIQGGALPKSFLPDPINGDSAFTKSFTCAPILGISTITKSFLQKPAEIIFIVLKTADDDLQLAKAGPYQFQGTGHN